MIDADGPLPSSRDVGDGFVCASDVPPDRRFTVQCRIPELWPHEHPGPTTADEALWRSVGRVINEMRPSTVADVERRIAKSFAACAGCCSAYGLACAHRDVAAYYAHELRDAAAALAEFRRALELDAGVGFGLDPYEEAAELYTQACGAHRQQHPQETDCAADCQRTRHIFWDDRRGYWQKRQGDPALCFGQCCVLKLTDEELERVLRESG